MIRSLVIAGQLLLWYLADKDISQFAYSALLFYHVALITWFLVGMAAALRRQEQVQVEEREGPTP